MNIDKKLERIRTVAAPPFLFTRIEARIQEHAVSRKWQLSAAAAFAVLVFLNIYVITNASRQHSKMETIVSGMMLNSSNDLYDE